MFPLKRLIKIQVVSAITNKECFDQKIRILFFPVSLNSCEPSDNSIFFSFWQEMSKFNFAKLPLIQNILQMHKDILDFLCSCMCCNERLFLDHQKDICSFVLQKGTNLYATHQIFCVNDLWIDRKILQCLILYWLSSFLLKKDVESLIKNSKHLKWIEINESGEQWMFC